MEVTQRKDALRLGLRHYFTGKPCKRGHIDKRFSKTGICMHCARLDTYSRRPPEIAAKIYQGRKEKIKAYAAANRERINRNSNTYRMQNLPKYAKYRAERRAKEIKAVPPWFGEIDRFVIDEAYRLARERLALTGVKWEVDHIIPIAGKNVCGLHCYNNIQLLTSVQNKSKGNRYYMENQHGSA